MPETLKEGEEMHALARRLFPICRALTGDGVRETLRILQEYIPLTIHEVPSGTQVFDWVVPKEWNIRDAYVIGPDGKKVIDFKKNNLHLVSYSTPVDGMFSLAELQEHLHSLPDQPEAIPYVTSFYEEQWGFCLAHTERMKLGEGTYRVHIDSDLKDGSLTYGEIILKGKSDKEIFLSTYICHPSLANNELSGPVLTTLLAKWIRSVPREYTYRIIFIPETIGSIAYVSRHIGAMKRNIIAGFNMTCVGDERTYSLMPSRKGDTLSDRVARAVLAARHPDYTPYTFLERGSDERQYCSPGIDLPVVSIMRSKYGTYPEYHTSLDDLSFVTPRGLQGTYDVMTECLEAIERNRTYVAMCLGEPQMGRRGLYATLYTPLGAKERDEHTRRMMHILAYADGSNDMLALGSLLGVPPRELLPAVDVLLTAGLIKEAS